MLRTLCASSFSFLPGITVTWGSSRHVTTQHRKRSRICNFMWCETQIMRVTLTEPREPSLLGIRVLNASLYNHYPFTSVRNWTIYSGFTEITHFTLGTVFWDSHSKRRTPLVGCEWLPENADNCSTLGGWVCTYLSGPCHREDKSLPLPSHSLLFCPFSRFSSWMRWGLLFKGRRECTSWFSVSLTKIWRMSLLLLFLRRHK